MSSGTVADAIGGLPGVQELVDRFYHEMEQNTRFHQLHAIHEAGASDTKDRLVLFLWLHFGGPFEYHKHYGHPRLRNSHLHVPVTPQLIEDWLDCMEISLLDTLGEGRHFQRVMKVFRKVAEFIGNDPRRAEQGAVSPSPR